MKGREAVWQEIQQARQRGAAVVWVTHAMDEAQQWSDRLLLLHAGQQLALETPQALRQSLQGGEKIELTGTCTLAADTLACLPGVTRVLRQGATLTLYCQKANDILRVVLAQETLPHIFCGLVSLEDVLRLRIEERTGPCKS
jgi:ABC-2 type transport system ATP-binding protein